jgi:hypothetical protein
VWIHTIYREAKYDVNWKLRENSKILKHSLRNNKRRAIPPTDGKEHGQQENTEEKRPCSFLFVEQMTRKYSQVE